MKKGFVLIETMVAMALSFILLASLTFSMRGQVQQWAHQIHALDQQLRQQAGFEKLLAEIKFSHLNRVSNAEISFQWYGLEKNQAVVWKIETGRLKKISNSHQYFTLSSDPKIEEEFKLLRPGLIEVGGQMAFARN